MKNNYKVYVHINKVNGKRYYGITCQEVERRWRNGKGYYKNKYFTNAINKYGWDNFEHIVIARGLTEEEAKWIKIKLIREWDTKNPEYGYNKTHKDNAQTEKAKKKISEANKGHTHTEEAKKKISESHKGKPQTEEHRNKIGESHKGKPVSEETKERISKANKGKDIGRPKRVYCVELDMYFETVTEASEFVGRACGNISAVLTGRNKTCGGYHWMYAEDVENNGVS